MLEVLTSYIEYDDRLCMGYNGSSLDKCYIQNMILCCEENLQGAQGIKHCSSPTDHQKDTHYPYEQAGYLRYQSHGVSLVYCGDNLYDQAHNHVFEPATPFRLMCRENMNHIQNRKNVKNSRFFCFSIIILLYEVR